MKCRDMAEIVTNYLEDALPITTRMAARLHLSLCEPCRRYVDQMRRTIRFLAAGPPAAAPPGEDDIVARMIGGAHDGEPEEPKH